MASHKKQHAVPRSYLKAWCDPATPQGQEPYVSHFARDGSNPRRRAPENLFFENDLYTISMPGGGRDLSIESGLSSIEGDFASLRRKKMTHHVALDERDIAIVCIFAAAMRARTPAQRDYLAKSWGGLKAKADAMIEWAKTASPAQLQAGASPRGRDDNLISPEFVESMATAPLQTSLAASIKAEAPLLAQMDAAIYFATGEYRFITSDNPCVWFDPESCRRPPMYQSPALGYRTTEVRLPISPKQCLVLNRHGFRGYRPAPDILVEAVNRVTRFACDKAFVNFENAARPYWFDPGVEPDDSWRKRYPDGMPDSTARVPAS